MIFTHKLIVITVHAQARWIPQITVINVTKKLSVCVKDVDTKFITIGCPYMTLSVVMPKGLNGLFLVGEG